MGMLREFKEFAMRGNVVDMAVGVIIGGAFGKIVTSLVNDMVMPPIGLLLGNMDFTELSLTLREAIPAEDAPGGVAIAAVTLNYGKFISTVIDFLILALVIFLTIKQLNRLKGQKPETPAAPTTRDCPRCCSKIAIAATRCPCCTSEVAAG